MRKRNQKMILVCAAIASAIGTIWLVAQKRPLHKPVHTQPFDADLSNRPRGQRDSEISEVERGSTRFGTNSLPPIMTDATFFFLDGRYVTPPYRIRRSELKLYINDLPYRTYNWPGKEYVADDPPVPPALKRMSKFGELDDSLGKNADWFGRKQAWISSHFPPDEFVKRFQEAVARLPPVKSAGIKIDPKSDFKTFVIESFAGERREYAIDNQDLRPKPKEEVVKILDAEIQDLDQTLRSGGFVATSSTGELSFAKDTPPWRRLPEAIDVLKTNDKPDVKLKKMVDALGFEPPAESYAPALVPLIMRFQPDAHLDDRLKRIREERERTAP